MSLLEKFKAFELKNSNKVNGGGCVTWVGTDGNGNTLWDAGDDNCQDIEGGCNNIDKPSDNIQVGDPYSNGSTTTTYTASSFAR